jgi:transposase
MGDTAASFPDSFEALRATVCDLRAALETKARALETKEHTLEAKTRELEARDALVEEQSLEIQRLIEAVRLLRHQRFGRTSERVPADQLGLFNEAEQLVDTEEDEADAGDAEIAVPAHTRRQRGRKPLPDWIPREEVLHDLSEAEKICAKDGAALQEIGREVSEQLEVIPAVFRVLRHVRPKYACPRCKTGVKIAPVPPQPIPKSLASPSLLAHVVVSKYADALPLYRQAGMLERAGIDLSRSTLATWMVRAGELVQPLLNLIGEEIVAGDFVQCDETPFQVLKEPGKPATSLSYLWVRRGGEADHPLLLYEYADSRRKAVPKRLLEGFRGVLQTDGYEGYTEVGAQPGIVHAGCWAHARRRFHDALKGQTGSGKKSARTSKAQQGLAWIQKLYRIERGLVEAAPEERQRVRQEKAQPVVEKIRSWLDQALPSVPPQSLTGKALGYLDRQWEKLVRYLEDGRIPIDTNLVENSIRPFALGRRNWLFADTPGGAQASANLYSVIQTAKANGLEPFAYLVHLFTELPKATRLEDFEALLPHRLDPGLLNR